MSDISSKSSPPERIISGSESKGERGKAGGERIIKDRRQLGRFRVDGSEGMPNVAQRLANKTSEMGGSAAETPGDLHDTGNAVVASDRRVVLPSVLSCISFPFTKSAG